MNFNLDLDLNCRLTILYLKQTVQYRYSQKYTSQRVFPCPSKAINLVSYDVLRKKLHKETTIDVAAICLLNCSYKIR